MKTRYSLLLLWILQVSISLYSSAARSYEYNAGANPVASGSDAVAIGESAVASGDYSTAVGATTDATNTGSIVIGNASRSVDKGATYLADIIY